jgi:hypothetical protein
MSRIRKNGWKCEYSWLRRVAWCPPTPSPTRLSPVRCGRGRKGNEPRNIHTGELLVTTCQGQLWIPVASLRHSNIRLPLLKKKCIPIFGACLHLWTIFIKIHFKNLTVHFRSLTCLYHYRTTGTTVRTVQQINGECLPFVRSVWY